MRTFFFLLPTPVRITAATHAFPSGCRGPGLTTYVRYLGSLPITLGYADLLLHLDRREKEDLRSVQTHLGLIARKCQGGDFRPTSRSGLGEDFQAEETGMKTVGGLRLGVRNQHSFFVLFMPSYVLLFKSSLLLKTYTHTKTFDAQIINKFTMPQTT